MFTALTTFIVGLLTIIVTLSEGAANRKATAKQEEKQNEYNKEAIELQGDLNRQAAAESYEYETNYADRMRKLMSTGITSWKAADILGNSSTSVQPAAVMANQALKKEPTDMSPITSLLGSLPGVAGQMEDRKMRKEQSKIDNEYREVELQIRREAVKIQRDLADHKISIEQAQFRYWDVAQNMMVTNPVDPDGPKIPLFLASALEKGETFQYDYRIKKNAAEMSDEELTEFRKQVTRNETLFRKQIEAMNDAHLMSQKEYEKIQYAIRILEKESSPEWLQARFDLLNAQKLRSMDGQEINQIIDSLKCDANTKAGLKLAFKLLKMFFDK